MLGKRNGFLSKVEIMEMREHWYLFMNISSVVERIVHPNCYYYGGCHDMGSLVHVRVVL